MRILLVSDYIFHKKGDEYFSKIPWPAHFAQLFGENARIVLFGRVSRERVDYQKYHKIDKEFYEVAPAPSWSGLKEFMCQAGAISSELKRHVRQSDVIILKLFYLNSILAYTIALRARRRPVLVSILVGDSASALLMRYDLIRFALLRRLSAAVVTGVVRHVLSHSDLVVCVSSALAQRYATEARNVIIANESWLRNSDITLREPPDDAVPRHLLFVGRLVPSKGIWEALKAVAVLHRAGYDVELTVVGDGPLRTELEAWVARQGLASRIHFTGFLRAQSPELLDVYRRADVLLLPSYAEGMPLVVLEAMAQGVAVIASRVGGVPDLVRHGETGLLVDPGHLGRLVDAVRSLVDAPPLWRSLIRNAYAVVHENTFERQMGKVAQAVMDIVRRKGLHG